MIECLAFIYYQKYFFMIKWTDGFFIFMWRYFVPCQSSYAWLTSGTKYSRIDEVKFVEESLLKNWRATVSLSRPSRLYLPQILLGPFLNTLPHLSFHWRPLAIFVKKLHYRCLTGSWIYLLFILKTFEPKSFLRYFLVLQKSFATVN